MSYTNLSYAETTSVQVVDKSTYLGCTMLYNLEVKPRILAVLATHSYKKLELRLGYFLINSFDFDNFLIFIQKHIKLGFYVTITDQRSFDLFLQKATTHTFNLNFDYTFQVNNKACKIVRNIKLQELISIVNCNANFFILLTIRAS